MDTTTMWLVVACSAIIIVTILISLPHLRDTFETARLSCPQMGANVRADKSLYLHCHLLMKEQAFLSASAGDDPANVECTYNNCPLLHRVMTEEEVRKA